MLDFEDFYWQQLSLRMAQLLCGLKHPPIPVFYGRGIFLRASDDRRLIQNRAPLQKKWLLRLLAVLFVYVLRGEGKTEAAALAAVAGEIGQAEETIGSWDDRLRKRQLGIRLVKWLEDLAYKAGQFRAAPDCQPFPENSLARELTQMTLCDFGVRYRRFKNENERDLDGHARNAMTEVMARHRLNVRLALEIERRKENGEPLSPVTILFDPGPNRDRERGLSKNLKFGDREGLLRLFD
jgi:hypothetical protein